MIFYFNTAEASKKLASNTAHRRKVDKGHPPLTREDHESFSENIEERESLRLWWEDRNLNTKYLEEELVMIGVGERSIEYINEEETVESELEARKQKLKRKIWGRY